MKLLPKSEASSRVRRLQSWMRDSDVDAVFVLQNADLFYFAGTVQVGVLVLPASGDPLFLIQKSVSRGQAESPWERLVPLGNPKKLPDHLAGEGLGKLRRVGLEMDVIPVQYYFRYRSMFPDTEFVDASDAIRKVRMIKSPYEVEEIRNAAAMLNRSFREVPGWVRPGVRELEISGRLEGHLRLLGHQGITRMRGLNYEISYGTVSSGPNACYPTCFPGPVGFVGLYPAIPNGGSDRKLQAGDSLMADIVGGFGGYIADKTRVFVLGELSSEMSRAHAFVLEIMREVESMLRPGTPCARIYGHVLDRIGDSPYADYFMGVGDSRVQFIGHGVGLELDELPVLAASSRMNLEEGMTIAIEPKLFFPEQGGVGIEDTYLITQTGFEKLTPFEEDLIHIHPAGD